MEASVASASRGSPSQRRARSDRATPPGSNDLSKIRKLRCLEALGRELEETIETPSPVACTGSFTLLRSFILSSCERLRSLRDAGVRGSLKGPRQVQRHSV